MPQNFHLVSLKILEFHLRKIFNQRVYIMAPSSSLVRTAAFQAVNTGSNPVGATDI